MGEIHHFVPKVHLKAGDNLAAFIEGCRTQLTVYGADLDFDADIWDITKAANRRASSQAERITFCTLATTDKGIRSEPMADPFKNFAKAYIRHQQGVQPTKRPTFRLAALRVLEQTLREVACDSSADPTATTVDILNQAVELTRVNFKLKSAYAIGRCLELIARFLDVNHMTPAALGWRSPIKRPGDSIRIGSAFEEQRAKKLPSAATLEALAAVFNLATEPRDVIQASVGALLMSAPERFAELLTLPENCEVNDDKNPYGLRWWPGKGADPQMKWVIPSMADTAKRAVDQIRQLTTSARIVAAWYERNPGKLYLQPDLEHLRGRDLDCSDIAVLLGLADCRGFLVKHKLSLHDGLASFAEVESAILTMLPSDFPVFDRKTNLTYSEALFVVLKGQFRGTPPIGCMIERVGKGHISDGFGARVGHRCASLFERLGFREPDGSPIRVTTHQFRHMLNTMAQKGGASQFDIARWSGRKDVSQNTAYDHESAGELLARVRVMVGDESSIFGLPAEIRVNTPATREEYALMVAPTAHTTEIGFCLHDFASSPCQLHMDCLRCEEHVCVKGNRHKTDVVRRQLAEARVLLAKAKVGMDEKEWGADHWVMAQMDTIERLEALLAILDDPKLPDGSIIRVGGPSGPSRLIVAAAERGIDLSRLNIRAVSTLGRAHSLLQDMRGDHGKTNTST